MWVQGTLGWRTAAHSHQQPRSPPAPRCSRPLLAHPPHPGEAPRQHHPTPANIWDRQVCAKWLGWAGRGPGSARAEGPPLPAPLPRGRGAMGSETWVWVRQLWGSAGGGRRGCCEKRERSGTGFQGHVRMSDQGHDVRCPHRWLGTPGLLERPKAETFLPCSHRCCFLLAFQATEPRVSAQPSCPPPPRRASSPRYRCGSCL